MYAAAAFKDEGNSIVTDEIPALGSPTKGASFKSLLKSNNKTMEEALQDVQKVC